MKVSEIRLMAVEEISTRLLDTKKDYMNLRFQAVSGQLTNTSKLKETRRLIAQYNTILNEKLMENEGEA